jgi:histidinol phosphatase-like PHP family hydrolase
MSPKSIVEKVYILAVVNYREGRIEFYEVEKEDVELLEIDANEYDIDLNKEFVKLAKENGQLIAIFGFDRIAEEGEE